LADLAAWPLVTYDASRRPESSLVRALESAGLRPRFACSTHDADLIKTYVRAGIGIGLLAELAVDAADREEFAVLDVDAALPDCIAWAVLGEGRVLRDCTLDLVRLLAPQLDPSDVRRALRGEPPSAWPEPPRWRESPADPRPAAPRRARKVA
jgi:DNA-binding transcriptional LysR family regulator